MSVLTDLQALEARVNGLKALLAKREGAAAACVNNADPYAHSQHMNAEHGPIAAIRKEYRDKVIEFINAKFAARHWDPVDVMEKAPLPRVPATRPASDADVIAKLREFLSKVPETATVASLKELIS